MSLSSPSCWPWARGFAATLLVSLLAQINHGFAAQRTLTVSIERISSPGLEVQNLDLEMHSRPQQSQSSLAIKLTGVQLGEQQANDISLSCAVFRLNSDDIACQQLQADTRYPPLDAPLQITGALSHAQAQQRSAMDLMVAHGESQLAIDGALSNQGDGELVIGLRPLDLAGVEALLADTPLSYLSGMSQGDLTVALQAWDPGQIQMDVTLEALGFDTQDGQFAAADMQISIDGRLSPLALPMPFDLNLQWHAGEFLAGPLYLASPGVPVTIELAGQVDDQQLRLINGALDDGDGVQVRVLDSVLPLADQSGLLLSMDVQKLDLALTAQRYLPAILSSAGLDGLEMAGRVHGQASLSDAEGLGLQFQVEDLYLDDPRQRLSAAGVSGDLLWSSTEQVLEGQFAWQSLALYRIDIGAGELPYRSSRGGFSLAQPISVPVMDGALDLRTLNVGVEEGELHTFDLIAELQPISMESLSSALAWPSLSGSLSGRIPGVRYQDGVLEVDGAMSFNAFDGLITLSDLRLERPFGVLPSLAANLSVERLDLAVLTQTFEFGLIEGQLSGRISNLRMLNWEPVQFDAALANPLDDPNRHRISQRAIENISSIGGSGAAAALSRGFLSVFEQFSYRRLGISCRLRNDVCEMGGVAPTGRGGYYLVQGAGVPRLDVVAFATEVDWPTLLSRLKAASGSGDVQIN